MWHGPWELDPKILAALITWLIYLFLFSARISGSWPGRKSAYVAILGFASYHGDLYRHQLYQRLARVYAQSGPASLM